MAILECPEGLDVTACPSVAPRESSSCILEQGSHQHQCTRSCTFGVYMSGGEPCYIQAEHTKELWMVAGLTEVAQLEQAGILRA